MFTTRLHSCHLTSTVGHARVTNWPISTMSPAGIDSVKLKVSHLQVQVICWSSASSGRRKINNRNPRKIKHKPKYHQSRSQQIQQIIQPETGNYGKFNMTWTQHQTPAVYRVSILLLPKFSSHIITGLISFILCCSLHLSLSDKGQMLSTYEGQCQAVWTGSWWL